MCNDIGRDAREVLSRREAVAVVGLAQFVAIFHDASGFTVQHCAVFGNGDLVNGGGFGE